MPKITFAMNSAHSAADTFSRLKTLFETDRDLKKLDSDYVCQFNDANFSGSAKGSKFSADMKVEDKGSSAALDLKIEIPFMFSPFKGMIRETLEKKLNKALG